MFDEFDEDVAYTYFLSYFNITFPLIVFIKSVNYISHEQILLWYQKSIRRKTACTFTYKNMQIVLPTILNL